MIRKITILSGLLLFLPFPAAAGEVEKSAVDYNRGVYTVEFAGRVTAGAADVYRLVTDHDHLYLLNDMILESRLLPRTGAPEQQRLVVLHVCILFFCRNMKVVESLREGGSGELIAVVVPVASDFESGRTVWRVTPEGASHSRFRMHSMFRPGFWVPPVIGPLLIRKKMEQELSVMMTRLEQYAGTVPGR